MVPLQVGTPRTRRAGWRSTAARPAAARATTCLRTPVLTAPTPTRSATASVSTAPSAIKIRTLPVGMSTAVSKSPSAGWRRGLSLPREPAPACTATAMLEGWYRQWPGGPSGSPATRVTTMRRAPRRACLGNTHSTSTRAWFAQTVMVRLSTARSSSSGSPPMPTAGRTSRFSAGATRPGSACPLVTISAAGRRSSTAAAVRGYRPGGGSVTAGNLMGRPSVHRTPA